MKKLLIICLVMSILVINISIASAEAIKMESKFIKVDESKLIQLASQEKFESLNLMMRKLVQNKISTEENKIELKEIIVIDFMYGEKDQIIIYYQTDLIN